MNPFLMNSQHITYKEQIEKDFGCSLIWERLEGKQACRIKSETAGNVFDKEKWDAMQEFMVDSMLKLENVLKTPLERVSQKLKEGELR